MSSLLVRILQYVFRASFFKDILLGMGMGLVASGGLKYIFDYYISKFVSTLPQFGQGLIGLVGLSGLDKAISIVIGAYMINILLKAGGISLKSFKK